MTENKAWECPRCGRMNAPFNPVCFCKPEEVETSVKSSDKPSEHLTDAAHYLNPYKPAQLPFGMKRTSVNLPQNPCGICGGKHWAGFECATLSKNTLPPNGEFI